VPILRKNKDQKLSAETEIDIKIQLNINEKFDNFVEIDAIDNDSPVIDDQ
jgi:hypothetical protein